MTTTVAVDLLFFKSMRSGIALLLINPKMDDFMKVSNRCCMLRSVSGFGCQKEVEFFCFLEKSIQTELALSLKNSY